MAIGFLRTFSKLPKLAVAAALVAFVLALGGLLAAYHQVSLIVTAVIPAAAGISILRRRAWGAYGFALFELAQATITPLALFRTSEVLKARLATLICLDLALALLFFFAGRSLTTAGARRGFMSPWIAVSALFTLPLFFFHAFSVPSGGMEDTLLPGDRMLVRVFPRVNPARGDIIVFHYPPDPTQTYVKRVIGLPGDRIRMTSRVVYRNGSALIEPYAVHKFPTVQNYRDNLPGNLSDLPVALPAAEIFAAKDMLQHHVESGEVVVPPGQYFVLGDNRDNSLDSRYWGFVDSSGIIGIPFVIYDSEVPPGQNITANGATTNRTRLSRIGKLPNS